MTAVYQRAENRVRNAADDFRHQNDNCHHREYVCVQSGIHFVVKFRLEAVDVADKKLHAEYADSIYQRRLERQNRLFFVHNNPLLQK